MVTKCTASLTFYNFTFCPHTVFMCFVWISEQTAIISLYSIKWLVFFKPRLSVFTVRYGLDIHIYLYNYFFIEEVSIDKYKNGYHLFHKSSSSTYAQEFQRADP